MLSVGGWSFAENETIARQKRNHIMDHAGIDHSCDCFGRLSNHPLFDRLRVIMMKDFPHGTDYLLIMAMAFVIVLVVIGGYWFGAFMASLFF